MQLPTHATRATRVVHRLAGLVVLVLAAMLLPALPAQAHIATSFVGKFVCLEDGKPMSGVRVELFSAWDADLLHVPPNIELEQTKYADGDGYVDFRVQAREEDYFMRVGLVSRHAEVANFLTLHNWFMDTWSNQNDVPLHNYGVIGVPGKQCALWNSLNEAGRDFEQTMGTRPPFGEVVGRFGAITAGAPFANYEKVWWPSGAPAQGRIPAHEFGHTFRHVYDGSEWHFRQDVLVHNYLRHHTPEACEVKGSGFAFNEGWANYWSGTPATECDANNYRIEATVTRALETLQNMCGLSRAEMVGVLRDNPGRIHSFQEFSNLAPCERPWLTPPSAVKVPRTPPRVTARGITSTARREVSGLLVQRRRLNAAIRTAVADLRKPLPCSSRPCPEEYSRVARPWLLRAQLANLTAAINTLKPLSRKRGALRLARKKPAKILPGIERRASTARKLGRKRAAAPLGKAVAAVRKGKPSGLRSQAVQIVTALKRGVAAGNGSALAALDWTSTTARPTRAGSIDDPVLHDPDTGEPVVDSTTRLWTANHPECTADEVSPTTLFHPEGDRIGVRGFVTPGAVDREVRVVWRHDRPGRADRVITHVVRTTDVEGEFRDSLDSDDWAQGYGRVWSVQAFYDGDLATLGSRSGRCGGLAEYP